MNNNQNSEKLDGSTVPLPHFDEDRDEPIEVVLARMRELFVSHETVINRLDELHHAGNNEELSNLLDDITYHVLEDNEEFLSNAKKMRSARPDEQIRIRDRQREIFNEAKELVALEAGLPVEQALDKVKKSQQKIAEILRNSLNMEQSVEIDDVLSALGIIEVDKDGNERFNYPEGLFPEDTDKRWKIYNESVIDYFRVERAVELGTRGRKDLETIDGSRRIAHNAIAHDIDELLGLTELPSTQWDFEKTRSLVAKMREKKYPTVETAERAATHDAVGAGLMGLEVLKALNIKIATLKLDN